MGVATGTAIQHGQERQLWAILQKTLGRKPHSTRHTMSAGPAIYTSSDTTLGNGFDAAVWQANMNGDILITPTNIPATPWAVWVAYNVDFGSLAYMQIAGPNPGTVAESA